MSVVSCTLVPHLLGARHAAGGCYNFRTCTIQLWTRMVPAGRCARSKAQTSIPVFRRACRCRRRVVAESVGSCSEPLFEDIYHYYETAAAWTVPPGLHAALASIQQAGVKICVVSNFDQRLRSILSVRPSPVTTKSPFFCCFCQLIMRFALLQMQCLSISVLHSSGRSSMDVLPVAQ